ncbi:MAG: RNA polymerase sigma factor [Candidatus Poribacteria bacterium]|nr:RNA polymerase sigma factor [Candidatus Poribacteria bacterium]
MKNSDVELIHSILAGDDSAFASLVEKHQKQVHALAWKKVGDFHIAEEITQDTFLKVYQKLSTLKNPNQFSGWLYVIATRRCLAWLRKKRMDTESLEDIDSEMIEEPTYSQYVAEEQAKVTVDEQREVVKKLLAKLKESERTVMVLHYFGDMTCEEISRFLGVSPSAIKSRLSRARQRLKKEEPMIREALSNFQISANLTENIMREVTNLQPVVPSGSNPFCLGCWLLLVLF